MFRAEDEWLRYYFWLPLEREKIKEYMKYIISYINNIWNILFNILLIYEIIIIIYYFQIIFERQILWLGVSSRISSTFYQLQTSLAHDQFNFSSLNCNVVHDWNFLFKILNRGLWSFFFLHMNSWKVLIFFSYIGKCYI